MTDSNSPDPSTPKQGFKVTLMQGVIGAVSLVGTTAIPLLVQKALNPPSPNAAPTAPAEVKPAQVAPASTSPQDASGAMVQDDDGKGRGKKKSKKND